MRNLIKNTYTNYMHLTQNLVPIGHLSYTFLLQLNGNSFVNTTVKIHSWNINVMSKELSSKEL